jgi:fatty acid amide hydrolase 2
MDTPPSASTLDLDRAAAVDLAAAIRQRAISPTELVDAFIARIERENPRLNAVIATRFDAARATAAAHTRRLMSTSADDLPPFLGVPCTIKETFAVEGMPHTAGNLRRRHVVAPADAPVVARLKAAGFVPLGVTNVPEMAFWYETDNLAWGRTNNPFDTSRTAGGSSGGEGAIVGVGASPVGLGSDVGGSIRMPAGFCGVFGHKPTGGLVPTTGHIPSPSPSLARFTCVGPLVRSARDLLPVLRILAGPDGTDRGAIETVDLRDSDVPAKRLTVHVIDEAGWIKPSDEVRAAVWRAAALLEHHGARVEHARPPELRSAFQMWGEAMQKGSLDGRPFIEWLGDGDAVSLPLELLRLIVGRPRHTKEALMFAALERAGQRLPIVRGGLEIRERLRARLRELLVDDTHIIVSPTFPVTAFLHGHGARYPGAFVYSALWNVLEQPATAVPMGLDRAGLPLSCQVIGRRGADRIVVGVAMQLETLLGGRVGVREGRPSFHVGAAAEPQHG